MYAVIEKNRLKISVAEFYTMDWYRNDQFLSRSEKHEIDYGYLEIDVHKNGKKYLTGFVIDPWEFIVDYISHQYKKDFQAPKSIRSVSLDAGTHIQMFTVDFLKAHSFVIDGMDKDLIFPQFCRHKGDLRIQGFEVLSVFSMIRYLSDRFNYKETTLARQGDMAYDLKTHRKKKIMLGQKRKKKVSPSP
jgi:hypothetical protein